jgi:hypothetical protein
VNHIRSLVYVPIVHTEKDMGTLAAQMKESFVSQYDEETWSEHWQAIQEMWDGLKLKIQQLKPDYKTIRLYQDGLPVCGFEERIIRDLSQKGSKNHQLLLWLIEQGAALEGTEDPGLLVEEYTHIKGILSAATDDARDKAVKAYETVATGLLSRRDRFISDRIEKTLKKGETGLLFLGMLHKVDELLSKDIKVSYLIHRLPFKRSFEMKVI